MTAFISLTFSRFSEMLQANKAKRKQSTVALLIIRGENVMLEEKQMQILRKRRRVASRFRQVVSSLVYQVTFIWHSSQISWIILASDRQKVTRLSWLYHL